MRMTLFKIISFMAVFLFAQGAVLPWVISNNLLPLWADILLVSAVIFAWIVLIERLAMKCIRIFCDWEKE